MVILKLREKYDGPKLAMIIVYEKASKNDQVDSLFSAEVGQTNFTVYARVVEDLNRFIADLMKSVLLSQIHKIIS